MDTARTWRLGHAENVIIYMCVLFPFRRRKIVEKFFLLFLGLFARQLLHYFFYFGVYHKHGSVIF
jgi:hypothetical protein